MSCTGLALPTPSNKAVPERVFLRTKIDSYQEAVKELKGALAGW
jgi:hypothetical protein